MRTFLTLATAIVAIGCGSSVDGDISTLNPSASDAPLLRNVTASSITATTAEITWTTDSATTSEIQYGTTTSYGSSTPLYGLSQLHDLTLSELTPNTLYHFSVKSRDGSGKLGTSDDATFTTLADGSTPPTNPTPPTDPTPPSDPTPPPGTHPFPLSFDDQQFFANAVAQAPFSIGCTTMSDLTVTQTDDNGDAVILNTCDGGTSTIQRVRVGGDGGVKDGNAREGYRCDGNGTMNIQDSWIEVTGVGDDHADALQCYDPNNSPTAKLNISNTTFVNHPGAANCSIFIADAFAVDLTLDNVMIWGGAYGFRFHTDGRPGSMSVSNVCFYGNGDDDNSFQYGAFLFDPYPPTLVAWENVNWCTIENGQLVKHGAIAAPF